MTYSIIKKSQLEGALRLDAEYYQPCYLEIINILSNQKLRSKQLSRLIRRPVVTGSTPKDRECLCDGSDIFFIKTDTVREGILDFDSADFLPVEQAKRNSEPKAGDVLVTIIGATFEIVGRAAMVSGDDPRMNINQNIALICPNQEISPSFLETFLRSKYGRMQLWQQSRQTEQVNLNCREVENIRIPIPNQYFQQEIDKTINYSHQLRIQSVNIYKEAEGILLKELGLENFEAEMKLFSIINLSDCQKANRIDAEYFQPKFYELFKIVTQNSKVESLDKIAKTQRGSLIAPQYYSDSGKQYIRGADFNDGKISKEKAVFVNVKFNPKNETIVSTGDIVFASIGSVGNLAIVDSNSAGSYISNNLSKILVNKEKLIPEYLMVVLRSIIGQSLFEKESSQTAQPKISDSQVKSFIIPVLPMQIQQQIADLVKKSHVARQKSKELLIEAKQKVEEMIEKDVNENDK